MNSPSIPENRSGFMANPYKYVAIAVASITALYLLFVFADNKGLQEKRAVTQVTQRHYRESSQTTVTSTSGGAVRSHARAVPAAWMVAVALEGGTGWAEVPPGVYNKMPEGTPVEVAYVRRRITGELSITSIRPVKPLK